MAKFEIKSTMRNIIIYCMLTASFSCNAVIYSFINTTTGTAEDAQYEYTIDSWTDDNNPNPCFGLPDCEISINHRHFEDGTGATPSIEWRGGCVVTSETMNALKQCLTSSDSPGIVLSLPYSSVFSHYGPAVTQECVGLFYGDFGSSEKGWKILPGSVCGIAPPPVGACSLQDSLTLDHGVLTSDTADGNTVSANLNIDCNQDLTAKVALVNAEEGIVMDNGNIISRIFVNEISLTEGPATVNLQTGSNSLLVKSKLQILNPTTGSYQASGVLVLTID